MLAPWQLLAQAEEKPPVWDPQLIWLTLGVVAVILVGAAIIAVVDRWRKRPFREKLSASDQLAQFRALFERGQLKAEEFERIRALLTERMKKEMEIPATPSPTKAPPNPPTPGNPPT
jgi:hypothetical protein